MEKILLTVGQAKAIEIFRENNNSDAEILMIWYREEQKPLTKLHAAIREMPLDDLAKALYVGYKVEQPEIKVGDWGFWDDPRGLAKTAFILIPASADNFFPDIWPSPYCGGESLKPSELRHATSEEIQSEKERRFWTELGREVGKLIVGDALKTHSNELNYVNDELITETDVDEDTARNWISSGLVEGFYPASAYIKFPVGDDS